MATRRTLNAGELGSKPLMEGREINIPDELGSNNPAIVLCYNRILQVIHGEFESVFAGEVPDERCCRAEGEQFSLLGNNQGEDGVRHGFFQGWEEVSGRADTSGQSSW